MNRHYTAPLAGLVAACALATTASAAIVGGAVTGGSAFEGGGVFQQLSLPFDPPNGAQNTVGLDTFNTNNLYAFNEDQNIVITDEIQVDVGSNPQPGDIVASHYVFFDPASTQQAIGYVDFDADVFGIVTSTDGLAGTDFLANTSVNYLNPNARGLELADFVSIDVANSRRILIDFLASSPGDFIRVLTRESSLAAVPGPAAAPLLLTGIAAAAFVRRRRRSASS